ncbi:MAG: aminodeoxychorismate synthase, component I [Armatimonadetes bacterium]|nr:aminodeoxychorismate synthase, component I [Armatimonadota bacterium]
MAAPSLLIRELAPAPEPAVAFERLLVGDQPFFLDGGRDFAGQGRYSFMGCDPFLTLRAKNGVVRLRRGDADEEVVDGDPFARFHALLREYALPRVQGPAPFWGGAVGYLAYDLCHHVERLPRSAVDDLDFPDLAFGFYDAVAAWDNLTGQAFICAPSLPGRPPAEERADALAARLTTRTPSLPEPDAPLGAGVVGNFERDEYIASVARAIEYIHAGDIFQVNLSQRFSADLLVHPWQLYRRARAGNPAPFAAYLGFPDGIVACHSPERFLRIEDRHVTTRPIKGTRPRGATPQDDARLAEELLSSEKDRAELVMIVDLERNDLGRVCSYGSVRVPELLTLESYATVHHLVSTVVGTLHEGRSAADLLRATFPGGSITGAPKVRAMEIIDELEPTQRAVYTGAVGWLGFDGDLDLNIVIRTFLIREGRVHWQVGGGIVADSDPAAEYEETLAKGFALKRALGV